MTALRLCLDRVAPARRDRPVSIELPPIDSAADHPPALAAILQSVVDGEITPSEAQALSSVLAEHRKAIETVEIEARIAALEEGTNHA
jgi:DNA-directed RNA polymerase specialized sigma24 family protein